MEDFGLKNAYEKQFLNKKVIEVKMLKTKKGLSVCLLFENGYQLNFTYNEKFLNLGKRLKQTMLEQDLKEILREEK